MKIVSGGRKYGKTLMSSELYQEIIKDNKDHPILFEVWSSTPWVVDSFTDTVNSERNESIVNWCFQNFGKEASPILGKSGNWYSGGASINGWRWMGFKTEEMMKEYLGAWPNPKN